MSDDTYALRSACGQRLLTRVLLNGRHLCRKLIHVALSILVLGEPPQTYHLNIVQETSLSCAASDISTSYDRAGRENLRPCRAPPAPRRCGARTWSSCDTASCPARAPRQHPAHALALELRRKFRSVRQHSCIRAFSLRSDALQPASAAIHTPATSWEPPLGAPLGSPPWEPPL